LTFTATNFNYRDGWNACVETVSLAAYALLPQKIYFLEVVENRPASRHNQKHNGRSEIVEKRNSQQNQLGQLGQLGKPAWPVFLCCEGEAGLDGFLVQAARAKAPKAQSDPNQNQLKPNFNLHKCF